MGSGRHSMTKQTRQALRMRPGQQRPRQQRSGQSRTGQQRTGVRIGHRAILGGAVAVLLAGGAATVLTNQHESLPVAFVIPGGE
ncbi:MAG: hypothetical protein OJJ54_02015 [Pseudonocardia sp.]|nr:hypothetical protein [Pseudonocardia sp.]